MLDFCWLSSLFRFVEHASFEVAYTRLEEDFDGVPIVSDDCSCLFCNLLIKVSLLIVITGAMLVLDAYVHHSLRLGCQNLFLVMEVTAVRSSNVDVGEELVPVESETSV